MIVVYLAGVLALWAELFAAAGGAGQLLGMAGHWRICDHSVVGVALFQFGAGTILGCFAVYLIIQALDGNLWYGVVFEAVMRGDYFIGGDLRWFVGILGRILRYSIGDGSQSRDSPGLMGKSRRRPSAKNLKQCCRGGGRFEVAAAAQPARMNKVIRRVLSSQFSTTSW